MGGATRPARWSACGWYRQTPRQMVSDPPKPPILPPHPPPPSLFPPRTIVDEDHKGSLSEKVGLCSPPKLKTIILRLRLPPPVSLCSLGSSLALWVATLTKPSLKLAHMPVPQTRPPPGARSQGVAPRHILDVMCGCAFNIDGVAVRTVLQCILYYYIRLSVGNRSDGGVGGDPLAQPEIHVPSRLHLKAPQHAWRPA